MPILGPRRERPQAHGAKGGGGVGAPQRRNAPRRLKLSIAERSSDRFRRGSVGIVSGEQPEQNASHGVDVRGRGRAFPCVEVLLGRHEGHGAEAFIRRRRGGHLISTFCGLMSAWMRPAWCDACTPRAI